MTTTTAPPDPALRQGEPPSAPDAALPGSWRAVAALFGVTVIGSWPTVLSFGPTWSTSYNEQGFFLVGEQPPQRFVRRAEGQPVVVLD